MPAHLFIKEEIIDLKNSFACGKAALNNARFYHRNWKGLSDYYRNIVNDLFEYLSDILGVGWSTKSYEWLQDKQKTFMNSQEYRDFLNKYNIEYDPNSEWQNKFIQDIQEDIDFYAWFITTPSCDGYKQYLNDKISDKQANRYLDKYIKLVEKIYKDKCPPRNYESKYWKIIFRENNKFHKALFNK